MEDKHIYCIIMAGGIGSRFWPISRNAKPKQFLDIIGTGKTFLQLTHERLRKLVPADRIMIVTAAPFKSLVEEQIPDILPEMLLLEPMRRNTAPCIAYATYKLLKKDASATVVVAPSDHLITDDDIFYSTLQSAIEFAKTRDVLISLGIKPLRPETGYGYIQARKTQGEMLNGHLVYPVKTFIEKPNAQMAQILIDSGEFYWNSGIFIWNLQAIARQFDLLLEPIGKAFKEGTPYYFTPEEDSYIQHVYETCRNVSIDYGIMEKASNCYVFSANFGWSDLGSWGSYYLHKDKDESRNVVLAANSMLEETEDCLILSKTEGKLVVVKGLRNHLVIDTPEALVICPRDDVQFKQIINRIAFEKEDYA